jgi:glycosyltransferase involved in cell wall biosynthesis
MKILIVSKSYPPDYVGGYELHCSQVAECLHRAGHEVRVLTSSYGLPTGGADVSASKREAIGGVPVERSLHHHPSDPPAGRFYAFNLAKRQLADSCRFIQILDEFQPDIVNWWNMEGLTKIILPIPAARHIPDVCCVDDTWLMSEYGLYGENEPLLWFHSWRGGWGPSFLRLLLRRALARWEKRTQRQGIPTKPFPNRFRHVCYISEFMRLEHVKRGLVFASSEVIYGGVSPERFYIQRPPLDKKGTLRFLYAGYIEAQRGLHTIIEALGLLPLDLRERVQLSIAHSGPPQPTQYLEQIKARIEQIGLSSRVKFLGKIPHDDMPQVYRDHDILISANTRQEGLPMNMMEAMCAGCAVIATGSGGAIEIADLPIFPKDHPVALSRLIAKLVRDPELVSQIAERGQNVVLRKFTFERMMEDFCNTFRALSEGDERQAKRNAHPAA